MTNGKIAYTYLNILQLFDCRICDPDVYAEHLLHIRLETMNINKLLYTSGSVQDNTMSWTTWCKAINFSPTHLDAVPKKSL